MGNPEGMMGTFSEGIVSALRDSKGSHLIQITAPISHGSSGGPVFNVYGQVIGISKSIWASGQNLNFAVPASEIDVLLKRARSIEGDSEEYPEK
jgi:S1-C subfamily serine protease